MVKWADFAINAVRYNYNHQHIDRVRVMPDNGEQLGPEQEQLRSQVVSAINRGITYVTVVKNQSGKWSRGQPVIVVRINGVDYIKTTNNGQANDNLENLPEF